MLQYDSSYLFSSEITHIWSIWIIMLKKWLSWISQGKVATSDTSKFSQDLTYQKLLKSVNFWQSYSKNKKVDVFGTPGISLSCTVSEILAIISQDFKSSCDPECAPILQNFNMCNGSTIYVQPAVKFARSKGMASAPKIRNGSRDPDHVHLGDSHSAWG